MIKVTKWTDDHWQYVEAEHWALHNCKSYCGFDLLDMSDISSWDGAADTGYEYSFDDEQDALMFSLKWL